MADKLISANALKKEVIEKISKDRQRRCVVIDDDFLSMIDDAPSVDAVPMVHGRWTYPIGMAWEYICSSCGANGGVVGSNYCPHCGAKMDGKAIAKNATTTKDGAK